MPHTYRKKFTDAEGTFIWQQMRENGRIRKVDSDYAGLVEWLSVGNKPTEIPYTPPTQEQKEYNLWYACDQYINGILMFNSIDQNAKDLFLLAVSRDDEGSDRKNKILSVYNWIEIIWTEYYVRKMTLQAGGDVSFDFSGIADYPENCTFFEIKLASGTI